MMSAPPLLPTLRSMTLLKPAEDGGEEEFSLLLLTHHFLPSSARAAWPSSRRPLHPPPVPDFHSQLCGRVFSSGEELRVFICKISTLQTHLRSSCYPQSFLLRQEWSLYGPQRSAEQICARNTRSLALKTSDQTGSSCNTWNYFPLKPRNTARRGALPQSDL